MTLPATSRGLSIPFRTKFLEIQVRDKTAALQPTLLRGHSPESCLSRRGLLAVYTIKATIEQQ